MSCHTGQMKKEAAATAAKGNRVARGSRPLARVVRAAANAAATTSDSKTNNIPLRFVATARATNSTRSTPSLSEKPRRIRRTSMSRVRAASGKISASLLTTALWKTN